LSRPIVMGIAGGSGSGKSTVLTRIIDSVGEDRIAVLDHDSYYYDLGHLPLEERERFNFDHPDALDTALLCEHVDGLLAWETVHKPVYDFTTHVRRTETVLIEPRPMIIVEGILVLADRRLRDRMDIKIFVDAADDVRLMRRIRRDMTERGRTIDSILDQYEKTVRPMHVEFVEPSKMSADVIIPRGGFNRVAIDMVLARVKALLKVGARPEHPVIRV